MNKLSPFMKKIVEDALDTSFKPFGPPGDDSFNGYYNFMLQIVSKEYEHVANDAKKLPLFANRKIDEIFNVYSKRYNVQVLKAMHHLNISFEAACVLVEQMSAEEEEKLPCMLVTLK